jgi:hypothetical protein
MDAAALQGRFCKDDAANAMFENQGSDAPFKPKVRAPTHEVSRGEEHERKRAGDGVQRATLRKILAEVSAVKAHEKSEEEAHEAQLVELTAQLDTLDVAIASELSTQRQESRDAESLLEAAHAELNDMHGEVLAFEAEGALEANGARSALERALRAHQSEKWCLTKEVTSQEAQVGTMREELRAQCAELSHLEVHCGGLERSLQRAVQSQLAYKGWSANVHYELRAVAAELQADQAKDDRESMLLQERAFELESGRAARNCALDSIETKRAREISNALDSSFVLESDCALQTLNSDGSVNSLAAPENCHTLESRSHRHKAWNRHEPLSDHDRDPSIGHVSGTEISRRTFDGNSSGAFASIRRTPGAAHHIIQSVAGGVRGHAGIGTCESNRVQVTGDGCASALYTTDIGQADCLERHRGPLRSPTLRQPPSLHRQSDHKLAARVSSGGPVTAHTRPLLAPALC